MSMNLYCMAWSLFLNRGVENKTDDLIFYDFLIKFDFDRLQTEYKIM